MTNPWFGRSPWRRSSYSSGGEGQCVEVSAAWRKSSYSAGGEGSCVEVGVSSTDRLVAVRDSKDPDGPVLSFTSDEWGGLLARIKSA